MPDPDFTIPVSIRSVAWSTDHRWPFVKPETECWECGSQRSLVHGGMHVYCGGCYASLQIQAREGTL
jgi:hypothetical protein